MGNAADLLVDYFRVFGHKSCSVGDLRPYISLIEENKRDDLAQRFMDTVGISSVSLPQNVQLIIVLKFSNFNSIRQNV